MKTPVLSVIIPTYNESKNIPLLLERLAATLAELPHEIIVVDDDSPDRTWEVAEEIARANPAVRVIRRFNATGLSSAVLTGMSTAQGQALAVIDADLQHDESILPAMCRAVVEEGHDVSIGTRGAHGGSYGDWARHRRFISLVASTLARILLPINISDPMSGFFAVSRKCYRNTAESINPLGFKILLEFIARGRNLKIKEIGYTFRNRVHGETKLSGSVIRNYLIALFDLRFGRYISSTFAMYAFVGVSGVIVNLLGFLLGEALGMPHLTTGLPGHFDPLYTAAPFGYQLAILTNYLLNNYMTFYEKRHRGWGNVKGLLLFEFISIFGLLVHTGTFQLLHNNGFLQGLLGGQTRELVNNGLATMVALVSNYYLNLNFTWSKRHG